MTATGESYLRGVLFKVLYVISVLLMLTLFKLIEDIPVSEITFFWCFFSILPGAGLLLMRGQLAGAFRSTRLFGHITRTVLGVSAMGLTFIAVRALPLPETVTLQYSQPLFVVAFSAIFLREAVGIFRLGAVVFVSLRWRPSADPGVMAANWPYGQP